MAGAFWTFRGEGSPEGVVEASPPALYVDEDTAFNESFATAVELEGLRLWLEERGDTSGFAEALARLKQRNATLVLVEDTVTALERLYQGPGAVAAADMRQQKQELIADLMARYNAMAESWDEPGPFGESVDTLNNANLALFRQYNQYVPGFRQLLREHDYRFADFFEQVRTLSARESEQRSQALLHLSERFDEHF